MEWIGSDCVYENFVYVMTFDLSLQAEADQSQKFPQSPHPFHLGLFIFRDVPLTNQRAHLIDYSPFIMLLLQS